MDDKIKYKVLVLMATYNGELFLKEQIESILEQRNVNVDILISDDGSNDKTLDIIKMYINTHRNIKLIRNKISKNNFGVNFYNLIQKSNPSNYSYIAFADQDDIFHKNKFINSINYLNKFNAAGLSSDVQCFGSSRKILSQSDRKTKYDFLFEGAGQGCTFILKANYFMHFRSFLKDNFDLITNFHFHDWLVYLYFRSNNYKWVFFHETLTFYRIHGNNSYGDKFSLSGMFLRLKKILNNWYIFQILLANEIYLKINPKGINFHRINFFSLISIFLFESRRKVFDRIILILFVSLRLRRRKK